MTATPTLARPAPRPAQTVESVLAHAHLRLGALALARVELETMAGLGLLDTRSLVDLAEVRWRTGDLLGAGEAANAALRDEDGAIVALVIAAEAAAAVGRPTEARRLAARVLAALGAGIDMIFAGMPRSSVWPADGAEPPPTAPTLFDREPELPMRPEETVPAGHDRAAPERVREASTAAPVMLGFWDGEAAIEPAAMPAPDPAAELDAGRAALVAGAHDQAALHFGLALRVAPALAPAVLEATEGARSASLSIVRGDAYRLAGHETSAAQAYAVAAQGGLPERRSRARQKSTALDENPGIQSEAGLDGDDPTGSDDAIDTEATIETDAVGAIETDALAGGPQPADDTEPTDELAQTAAVADPPAGTGETGVTAIG